MAIISKNNSYHNVHPAKKVVLYNEFSTILAQNLLQAKKSAYQIIPYIDPFGLPVKFFEGGFNCKPSLATMLLNQRFY